MKLKPLIITGLCLLTAAFANAAKLKVGYSDWPGYTVLEVAKQKGWFKEAGLDVELVWFDYLPSLDAFSAGKIDAERHACARCRDARTDIGDQPKADQCGAQPGLSAIHSI